MKFDVTIVGSGLGGLLVALHLAQSRKVVVISKRAQRRIRLLKEEIDQYYAYFRTTRDLLELRNLVEVASLIVDSALSRREGRGLHFSRDYPDNLPKALPSVLSPLRCKSS